MKSAQDKWDETVDKRVELFGRNPEVIDDPILVYYIDKKEEYDRKAV